MQPGRWQGEIRLPRSLEAAIDQRLDRLSSDAAVLAGHLARLASATHLNALRDHSGFGSSTFTRSAGELLHRGVIRWVDDDRLDFAHDQLRARAKFRFPVSPDRGGPVPWLLAERRRLAAAMFVVAVATAGWAGNHALRGTTAEPPPYGGAKVLLSFNDTLFEVQPTRQSPEEWMVRPATYAHPPGDQNKLAWPSDGGDPVWYGDVPGEGGPDVVRTEGGVEQAIIKGPTDDNLQDISPEGERILFTRDDPSTPRMYDLGLWLFDRKASVERRLYQSNAGRLGGRWAPDGTRILAFDALNDSAFVMTPEGVVRHRYFVPEIDAACWSGSGRFLAIADARISPRLITVSTQGDPISTLTHNVLTGPLACSPDGAVVVYNAVRAHHPITVVHDIESDMISPLTQPISIHARSVQWLVTAPTAVPIDLHVVPLTEPLDLGEQRAVTAELQFSDGTVRPGHIEWRSLDTNIASISSDGVVTANGRGHTRVTGEFAGWLRDSVDVMVTGYTVSGHLLHDSFETLDTMVWHAHGKPKPASVRFAGKPALALTGDANYWDGVVGKSGFHHNAGLTLEFEFRLVANRPDRQAIDVCLTDSVLQADHSEEGSSTVRAEQICFRYPGDAFRRFDPLEAAFGTAVRGTRVPVPEGVTRGEWISAAIQLRADGEVSLFVGHEFVTTLDVYASTTAWSTWRPEIGAYADGTDVLVRNVTLWPGLRHRTKR
jgi:hypothetical protein